MSPTFARDCGSARIVHDEDSVRLEPRMERDAQRPARRHPEATGERMSRNSCRQGHTVLYDTDPPSLFPPMKSRPEPSPAPVTQVLRLWEPPAIFVNLKAVQLSALGVAEPGRQGGSRRRRRPRLRSSRAHARTLIAQNEATISAARVRMLRGV